MPVIVIRLVVMVVAVVMAMMMSMVVIVVMPVIVGVAADLHVATQTASAFFAHIKISPPRRFPVPVRVATHRSGCGTGGIG